MKMNLEQLKKIYQSQILGKIPSSAERCPSPEEIYALFGTSTPSRKRDKIVDHLTACPFCLREFQLYLNIFRASQEAIQGIGAVFSRDGHTSMNIRKPFASSPFRRENRSIFMRLWKPIAIPLSLCILAGLIILASRWPSLTGRHEERGAPGQIRLLSPKNEEAAGRPLVFRWEMPAKPDYYVLELFNAALLPIWKSSELSETSLLLPPTVLGKMSEGEAYFWMVTAVFPENIRAESALEVFRLKK